LLVIVCACCRLLLLCRRRLRYCCDSSFTHSAATPPSPPFKHTMHTVAFDARKRKAGGGDEDGMERTYDLLWHDLIQHREGKGTCVGGGMGTDLI
jgi:hypothetical protein